MTQVQMQLQRENINIKPSPTQSANVLIIELVLANVLNIFPCTFQHGWL